MQTEVDNGKRELEANVPKEFHCLFDRRDGATLFVQELPKAFSPASVVTESAEKRAWEFVGAFYRTQRRYYEALLIYAALYDHMLTAQEQARTRYP